jgi:beta-glucosidase
MNTFKSLLFLTSIITLSTACHPNVKNAQESYEQKADSVLKLMTLDEKIGQLTLFTSDWAVTGPSIRNDYLQLIKEGKVGAVFNAYTVDYVTKLQKAAVEGSRLHIPLLFGYDVIHGHRTIFPIPLAQASSWDLAAIRQSERIAATEATAEGINWAYAPMVDISRDPRWGRVMEGAGEDTWLGCRIAEARIKGFQGTDFSHNNTLLACAKHFAAYGAPQAGRDYNTVDMSDRSLYEWYLPPYKTCVDAGVASVMTSFNEIAGVPSTSNKWLLTDLLRNQWKFNGFVVTDYTSINELIPHGVAADSAQAGELAINAGVDMDMQGSIYLNYLSQLVKEKKVSETTIDNAVKRILEAKFKLGLFENPFKYCDKNREKTDIMKPEFLSFARQFAAKSCVLLKNTKETLPLSKNIKSVAIIGPLADSKEDMLGSWSAAGQWEKCVTLREAIKEKLPESVKITFAKGCNVNDNDESLIKQAIAAARNSEVVILALGESRDMSGEAASRTLISLPGIQLKLAEAVIKTGKPTAVVLFNGRPLAIPELDSIAPALLEAWFGGTQAGNGIADVLFGDYNPSGKLTMTFPRNAGQIPIFYNTKNTGRPVDPLHPNEKYKSRYIDCPNSPLYPFGYGLSYTTFKYSGIRLNKPEFEHNDKIVASVDIANTGKYDGEEVAQLYVRDMVGDVTRPVKELKGFQKVLIKKGETKTVSFILPTSVLSYYHQDMRYTWDAGTFELFIGTSSQEDQRIGFTVK